LKSTPISNDRGFNALTSDYDLAGRHGRAGYHDRRSRRDYAAKPISRLPVVDASGKLIGLVSESDFIRRAEIGTQRKHGRRPRLLLGSGSGAPHLAAKP